MNYSKAENRNIKRSTKTIELKTPNGKGVVHEKQHAFMKMSSINGHKVVLSNDYDEILTEIINYMRDTRILCVYCSRKFKSVETLTNHHKFFHRISNICSCVFVTNPNMVIPLFD